MITSRSYIWIIPLVLALTACQSPPKASPPDPAHTPPALSSEELPTGAWSRISGDSPFATEATAQAIAKAALGPDAERVRLRALYTQSVAGVNVRAYLAIQRETGWDLMTVELFRDLNGRWK